MHHCKTDVMDSVTFDESPVAELADNNNNNSSDLKKKNEIYSLRQRNQRKTKSRGVVSNAFDIESGCNGNMKTRGNDNVKTIGKRIPSVSYSKIKGEKSEKPKSKAAPLSKYRRKTANARERTRMREINSAFEHLRQCVPVSITGVETPSTNEKLTKITTLRLAMKYIRILSEILTKCDQNSVNNNNNENGEVNLNSLNSIIDYQEIYNDILNDTLFKPTVTKPTGGRKELKKQNAPPPPPKVKKPSKPRKKYTRKQDNKIIQNIIKQELNPSLNTSCLDSPMDFGLTLESDGESLQLSEPCLSPLETQIKSFSSHALELGLLLESDGESLELSEPCLSPLSHLDALNPFSDLLHAGFNEPSALEMYLS